MSNAIRKRKRTNLGLMALEPRWMFDGAAVADATHTAPDAAAKVLIPDAPAPVEVTAADPSQNNEKKEVVFVDTSVAKYKTLEAAVKDGVGIVEIDGAMSGLAQLAKWAETHTGYDSISLLSHGTEASVQIGTDSLGDASLSDGAVQAELAQIGHSLNAGGDLLLYGCNVARGADGQRFIDGIAAATGADVAASGNVTGMDGDWTLEKATGSVTTEPVDPAALAGFAGNLAGPASPFQIVVENPGNADSGIYLYDTAKDADNNIYVVGNFRTSVTFTINGQATTFTGPDNNSLGYVAKYDTTGACLWAKVVGEYVNWTTKVSALAIAIDSDGNVIVGGHYEGTADFDPGAGTQNKTSSGKSDIFVEKLDSSGNYLWVQTYGSADATAYENLYGLAVVGTQIAFGGTFGRNSATSIDFGGTTLTSGNSAAGYVVSLDANGATQWAYKYDNAAVNYNENVYSVKSDNSNFYVVGKVNNNEVINSAPGGAADLTVNYSLFLQKLDTDGTSQWFETMASASTIDVNHGNGTMAVDSAGDLILTGYYSGTVNFDPTDTHTLTSGGTDNNVFLAKYSGTDGSYVWAKSIGGSGNMGSYGGAVTTDANNNLYVGGMTTSTSMNIDPAGGADGAVADLNAYSFFVDKLDSTGSFVWGRTGTSTDRINITGVIYVNGVTALAGSTQGNITSISASGTPISRVSYNAGFVEGFGSDGTPYRAAGSGGGGTTTTTTVTNSPSPTPQAAPPPVVVAPPPAPPPVVEPPRTIVRDAAPTPVFAPLPPISEAPKAPVGEAAKTAAPVVVAPPVIPVVVTTQFTPSTADGTFRVPIVTATQGGPAVEGLMALRPEIQTPVITDGPVRVALPVDAFAHTRSDAVVTLNAIRINGQPLPQWLNFDSRSGTLAGQPPADFKGTMVVKIVARDDKGQEATITVRINGLPEKTGAVRDGNVIKLGHHLRDKPAGKLAFTQQLKLAARNAAIRFS